MSFDDLPIIQCPPTPSDEELQADRDVKHVKEVEAWFARQELAAKRRDPAQLWYPDSADHIPPQAVQG